MYFETPEVVQKQDTLKIDYEVVYQNNILEYKLLLNNLKQWSNNDPLCEEKRHLLGLIQVACNDRHKHTFYSVNLTESTEFNKFIAMLSVSCLIAI